MKIRKCYMGENTYHRNLVPSRKYFCSLEGVMCLVGPRLGVIRSFQSAGKMTYTIHEDQQQKYWILNYFNTNWQNRDFVALVCGHCEELWGRLVFPPDHGRVPFGAFVCVAQTVLGHRRTGFGCPQWSGRDSSTRGAWGPNAEPRLSANARGFLDFLDLNIWKYHHRGTIWKLCSGKLNWDNKKILIMRDNGMDGDRVMSCIL